MDRSIKGALQVGVHRIDYSRCRDILAAATLLHERIDGRRGKEFALPHND